MKNRLHLKDSKTGKNFIFFNEDISQVSFSDEVDTDGNFSLRVYRNAAETILLKFPDQEQRLKALQMLDFYMANQNEPIQKTIEPVSPVNENSTNGDTENFNNIVIEPVNEDLKETSEVESQ